MESVKWATALFSTPSFICQLSDCKSQSEVGVGVPGPYVRELNLE
jgi:hypothetical protein